MSIEPDPAAAERRLIDDRSLAEFPEMNPGPVLRLDREGTVLFVNRAGRSLFGPDARAGASWLSLCPEMDDAKWTTILDARVPIEFEVEVGHRVVVFTYALGPRGIQVFVYGNDVTRVRHAERQVAQQAAELAEMARFPDMNPGPVCRLNRDACVILANAAARRLFDREDLTGVSWLELCPGITPAMWKRIAESSDGVMHEAKVGERHMMFTHTPPSGEGRNVFVYGSDLTEQKLAERALLQTEKMATLGTLAAGVAHELNNPAAAAQRAAEQLQTAFGGLRNAELALRTIRLSDDESTALGELDARARDTAGCGCNLDPLERSDLEAQIEDWLEAAGVDEGWSIAPALVDLGFDAKELDRVARRFTDDHVAPVLQWLSYAQPVFGLLEEIRHGAGRVSEIVSALKVYSYVGQAGVQAVDVNDGLRQTLVILRSKLKRGIAVEQHFAHDLPRIEARGTELNQVWTNLIDNAAYAMEGQGRLIIRTARANGWIVVEIEDSGPGIPESIRRKIFDPFFTTKPPGQGTGLGLHTSWDIIVRRHHGTIEVESEPGRTRFVVRLPVDTEPEDVEAAVDTTHEEG